MNIKYRLMRYPAPQRARQSGYSLVELSVAVVIALFLLTGLFTILQNTRRTSTTQTALTQLQDNQRIAMTMLGETLQEAGTRPNAWTNPLTSAFGTSGSWLPGQIVVGAANAPYGESVTVRYADDGSGSVLGCLGTADGVAGNPHYYQFLVVGVVVGANTVPTLECVKDGAAAGIPLVSNVASLTFRYGVDSSTGGTARAANTYLPAATLAANQLAGTQPDWTQVYSIKMTVSFSNPLVGQPGQTQATLTFTRVISIQTMNGVKI